MLIEKDLLCIMANRSHYRRFKKLVGDKLDSITLKIVEDLEEWWELVEEDEVDWAGFQQWFFLKKHQRMKPEQRAVYRELFANLEVYVPNATLVEELEHTFITQHYAEQLGVVADKVAEGSIEADLSEASEILRSWEGEVGKVGENASLIVTDDIDSIAEAMVAGNGFDWRLNELNLSLGPLRVGDLCLIAARPETGKTTLLASEVSFMAPQADNIPDFKGRPVVWFNNEEEDRKVKFRVGQSAIGWTNKMILADPHSAKAEKDRVIGDKVLIVNARRMDMFEIEIFCKEYNPCLIIFDQLRKVGGYEKRSNSEVARLAKIFQHARMLATEYGPVIAVHQARGDATDQMFLRDNQLEGSQTEVQGELDVQIMLGAEDKTTQERGIAIVKNKLAGGDKTEELYRHHKWTVRILPEIGRYEGDM